MNQRMTILASGLLTLLACTLPTHAMELEIGKPAPGIKVEQWARGDQVDSFKKDHVYVVEFWATWCGPCLRGMPHLSELQEKYADDVTIIGISNEEPQKVTSFLEKPEWQEKVRYTIAIDPGRNMWNNYMKPIGRSSIPTAFIVGAGGDVEWIGHPASMDQALDSVVKGTWDAGKFKEEFAAEQKTRALMNKLRKPMAEARNKKDYEALLGYYEEIASADPSNPTWQVNSFKLLIGPMNQPEKGYDLGRKIVAADGKDSRTLNSIAWYVVDSNEVRKRDLQFALSTAMKADKITGHKDANIVDTLARCYWEMGDRSQAIALQEKAVELAGDDERSREGMTKTLQEYQRKIKEAKTGTE